MVSSLLLSWWSWRDAIHPEIDTMVQWTFVLGWHMLHADIAKGWQRKSISAASWMCSRRWFGPRGRAHRLSADAGAKYTGLGRDAALSWGRQAAIHPRRPASRTAFYCHARCWSARSRSLIGDKCNAR